jgi:ubiquinone/menaquinone biosynthesis C-methylase UbiE
MSKAEEKMMKEMLKDAGLDFMDLGFGTGKKTTKTSKAKKEDHDDDGWEDCSDEEEALPVKAETKNVADKGKKSAKDKDEEE